MRIETQATPDRHAVESSDHSLQQILMDSTSRGRIDMRSDGSAQQSDHLTIANQLDAFIDLTVGPRDGRATSLVDAVQAGRRSRIDAKVT